MVVGPSALTGCSEVGVKPAEERLVAATGSRRAGALNVGGWGFAAMPNCGIAAKCALAVKSNKLRCVIGGWGAAAAAASPAPMDGELEQPAATSGFWVSGVLFHAHGAVFAEVLSATAAQATQCFHASAQLLHGEKLWFLSPPAIRPAFDGDVTQMQAPHPFPLPPPLLHVSPFLWITVVCAVAAAVCGTGAAVAQQRAGRGAAAAGAGCSADAAAAA